MPTVEEALQRWPVMTRKSAFEGGHVRYFTGKACRSGHVSQRTVASGMCIECTRMYAAKFRNRKNGGGGYATVAVTCHPDDEEIIRQFVAGINARREAPQGVGADMTATRLAVFPELANAPPGYAPPKPVLR